MAAASKLFISSTFFPNSDGYIAALKTIEILERDSVLDNIWEKGGRFLKKIEEIVDKYDVGAELSGLAPMFYITFKTDETDPTGQDGTTFTRSSSVEASSYTRTTTDISATDTANKTLEITAKAIDEAMAYVHDKYHRNLYKK